MLWIFGCLIVALGLDTLIIEIMDVPPVFWVNVHAFITIIMIALILLVNKIIKKKDKKEEEAE